MDPNEIINPKKTVERRLREAEAPAQPASTPTGGGFTKQWTEAERKAHAAALAAKLRSRK